jgi:phosphate:Na+ symporter
MLEDVMPGSQIVEILSAVVGGLCIFLLGMKNMSDGMQAIAGSRLRKMISAITDNRFLACGTGAFVTCLIQSSSVTTVMVVGMVNAGVMTLQQAIGVILGADIGTTITAWIVSLDILEYGLPILGLAGFFFLFTKNERLRYSAMMIMGIGMIFFGLELMKDGLYPLRDSEAFVAWFSKFDPSSFPGLIKCILVGAGVTAVVQSSSATVAITITLARSGVIEYDTAVALVLGENIGTTVTAYLASLGAGTNARRVAYAHIAIKLIGVSIMACIFPFYLGLLNKFISLDMDIAMRIAFAHTFFNIFIVLLFLPAIALLAALLIKLSPDKPHKEPPRLTFLDVRLLDTPAFGIQQSADEIIRMSEGVGKMLDWLRAAIDEDERDEVRERKLFHREELLDIMQKEIVEFLGELLTGSVPNDVMTEARRQLRIADEYESISDYIQSIIKLRLKIEANGRKMSDTEKRDILALHDQVSKYVAMISAAVKDANPTVLSKALSQGATITHVVKDTRDAHITRVEKQHSSALSCLIFVDILQAYRKIKDHSVNIAEALAGEK